MNKKALKHGILSRGKEARQIDLHLSLLFWKVNSAFLWTMIVPNAWAETLNAWGRADKQEVFLRRGWR